MRTLGIIFLMITMVGRILAQELVDSKTKRIELEGELIYTTISYDFSGKIIFTIGKNKSMNSNSLTLDSLEFLKLISKIKEMVHVSIKEKTKANNDPDYLFVSESKIELLVNNNGKGISLKFHVENNYKLKLSFICLSIITDELMNGNGSLVSKDYVSFKHLEELYKTIETIVGKEIETNKRTSDLDKTTFEKLKKQNSNN